MALTATMCSAQARAADLLPIGSAPSYSDYLLITWPLPWPRDIGLIESLSEVQARCEALAPHRRLRVQALVPSDRARRDAITVVHHSRPPGPFRGFARQERQVALAELVDVCEEFLGASDQLRAPDLSDPLVAGPRDVLLCGHGRRDVCCGRLGTHLLAEMPASPAGVNLWRTSHLGGHRYAPTALSFPEGAYWGFLDVGSLRTVMDRRADPVTIIDRYRGSAGFEHPGAQAVDAALLADEGWRALSYERTATVVALGDGRDEVSFAFTRPDGSTGALLAVTELGRRVELTECEGVGPGEVVDEVRLVSLERS